jgi:phosphohistidine phosphatase
MGEVIRDEKLTPDVIISSDAVRASATAEAVARAAGYAGEIMLEPLLYLASGDSILEVLRSVTDVAAATVMIVGHNPGLEALVAHLTGEQPDLPTATLVQIDLPIDRWSDLAASTRGTLIALWRPKELPI